MLIIAPAAILHAVGIIVTPPAFLLCYLLAAAQLCIGLISWGARKLMDMQAIRLIAISFIVFQGGPALGMLSASGSASCQAMSSR